jgi:hypothetical protein
MSRRSDSLFSSLLSFRDKKEKDIQREDAEDILICIQKKPLGRGEEERRGRR